jgi:hypothetical protein
LMRVCCATHRVQVQKQLNSIWWHELA